MLYKEIRGLFWLMAAHSVLAVVLAARLPADGWFVSDPGARLVAARAVIDHPTRPFEVDLPGVPSALAADLPQPYVAAHGDHAHAIAPPLFPILAAPFLALFGLPGLFVVPMVAWIAIGPLTAKLAEQLDIDAKPWLVMVASIVATPFVFYGLEFWDHAPAVACVLAGTVLALREPAGVASRAAAGALWILSLQLRPEMAAGVVAAAAVVALRRSPRVLIAAGFGAAVAAAPFVVYNLAHFGQITSPHVAINLALVGERWWQERLVDARSWFGTTNPVSIAGFAAIGAGWLCLASARVRAFSPRIALLGAVLISFEAAFGRENGQNFFRAFPLGILALMPTMSVGRRSRDLALLVILPLVGCWLTAPNDGGGQWGARYLLVIVPPMLILAIQRFSQLTRAHRGVLLLGLWFLVAGLVVSRTAYQELRGAKRYYSRLAATTAAQMGDARHLLTDAWWVPAAHAAVIDYRRTAVIDRAADAGRVLSAFSRDDVLAVTDRTETKFVDWTIDTCYRVGEEMRSADGRLRYARLSCR